MVLDHDGCLAERYSCREVGAGLRCRASMRNGDILQASDLAKEKEQERKFNAHEGGVVLWMFSRFEILLHVEV